MAIITISRELAALGDETAKELARSLPGYRFVDRMTLESRIRSYGISDEDLKKYDECKPAFFSTLSEGRDRYLHYLKAAVLDEARGGNVIFIGRGAFTVFKSLPCLLPVMLVSPLAVRIERLRGYFLCDDKKAREIIAKNDAERDAFHRYFFDIRWRDAAQYRLTLNTAYFSPEMCAAIIRGAVLCISDKEAEAASAKRLRELCLAQNVIHHIIYEKDIPVHFLDASVISEEVVLYGVVNTATSAQAALEAAKEVSGVTAARTDIQVIQDYALFH